MVAELYHKDEWRFSAVGQGFNGGLDAVIKHFGGTVPEDELPLASPLTKLPPAQIPQEDLGQSSSKLITLSKAGDEHKIDLRKNHSTFTICCNLSWQPAAAANNQLLSHVFQSLSGKQDLDLGCMWDDINGDKGVIQALGRSFGRKTKHPFIKLDRDDRDGNSSTGENLFIFRPLEHNRILIFAYVYQGQTFASVDAHLKLAMSNGETVEIFLDAPSRNRSFCGAVLIEMHGDKVILRKENKYFAGHVQCDEHYGFGITWRHGSKRSSS